MELVTFQHLAILPIIPTREFDVTLSDQESRYGNHPVRPVVHVLDLSSYFEGFSPRHFANLPVELVASEEKQQRPEKFASPQTIDRNAAESKKSSRPAGKVLPRSMGRESRPFCGWILVHARHQPLGPSSFKARRSIYICLITFFIRISSRGSTFFWRVRHSTASDSSPYSGESRACAPRIPIRGRYMPFSSYLLFLDSDSSIPYHRGTFTTA
ncbi:hypothetical protein K438DRAFT_1955356 [Mycena galopus ATCC 62051]|nr:hypothetical protein K438DRAFT_1955356 [Mycena galopus ATCC 62051]